MPNETQPLQDSVTVWTEVPTSTKVCLWRWTVGRPMSEIGRILFKKSALATIDSDADRGRAGHCARSAECEPPHRSDLCHFAEVLGCGGQVELVSGSIWTPKTQAIQLQDALEVGEQHLDLLSLAA